MVGADDALSMIRRLMRTQLEGGAWRSTLDSAISDATDSGDLWTAPSLAGLGAIYLSAEGRFREALSDLNHAIEVSSVDQSLTRRLMANRASVEALGGDPTAAIRTIGVASKHLDRASDEERLQFIANAHVALLISLAEEPAERWTSSIAEAEGRDMDWLAAGVKLWLVPWLIATGSPTEAASLTRSLSSQARAQRSTWRTEGARIYEAGLALARGEPDLATMETSLSAHNMYSSWQAALLTLRHALDAGDASAMARRGEQADLLAERFDGAFFNQIPVGGVLADIYAGEPFEAEGFVPEQVTLVNLGSLLALMEAIAVGGSQAAAATWLHWLDEAWPPHVVTSLEWPVSVARIRGLLAARAGAFDRGIRDLEAAVAWADSVGYRVEATIARLQLTDLLSRAPTAARRMAWEPTLEIARRAARKHGVHVPTHVYAASRASWSGVFDNVPPPLTPREAEVLAALATGATYKRAAEELGIGWRTVQSHAHAAYGKLGVRSRVEALDQARAIGLI